MPIIEDHKPKWKKYTANKKQIQRWKEYLILETEMIDKHIEVGSEKYVTLSDVQDILNKLEGQITLDNLSDGNAK